MFERTLAVNVTATWRLIRATDPLLRRSDAGRAVVISSSVAHTHKAFWSLYGATKAACEALARSWAFETGDSALRINSVDPGATRTAMRRQAMPGEDPMSLPSVAETGKLFRVREDRFADYRLPD